MRKFETALNLIQFKPGQRMTIIGKSGSGKSYFLHNIIRPKLKYRVIYDYKHEIIPLPGEKVFYRPGDFKANPNTPWVVYRPHTGTDEEFNELCNIVYLRGYTQLVIDDMSDHAPVGRMQRHHSELIRLGRSRECGVITCVQEPVGINNKIFSQSEHFVLFETKLESHRKKLAGFMGPEAFEVPPKFAFWYDGPGLDRPVLVSPIKGNKVSIREGGV